ncbi:MAG: hypothetical protein LCH39_05550 [Proteobacteria bacterium]|nr:hypothetical protein [Pseudomonadota bacterium]
MGDIDPEFADQVRQKRYAKVSASFYMPDAGNNPTPGSYALKHVGFLGAAAPAVKGLKQAQFATAGEGVMTFGDLTVAEVEAFYQRQLGRSENDKLLEKLVREGRVLPCHKDQLVSFMDSLSGAGEVSFADASGAQVSVEALIFFKRFISTLPVVVNYGSITNQFADPFEDGEKRANYKVPDGYEVSPERALLHDRAMSVSRNKGISYEEALSSLA